MGIIHVIIEGAPKKSQHLFWDALNKHVYANKLHICAVDGFKNIQKCFDALNWDKRNDIVLLICDNPANNPYLRDAVPRLAMHIRSFDNVYLIKERCFEDTFLCFKYLESWLYSEDVWSTVTNGTRLSDRLEYRALSAYRRNPNKWYASRLIKQLLAKYSITFKEGKDGFIQCVALPSGGTGIRHITQETVAAYILMSVTKNSCAFYISKSDYGDCWRCSCIDVNCCPRLLHSKGDKHIESAFRYNLKCGLHANSTKWDSRTKLIFFLRHSDLGAQLIAVQDSLTKNGYSTADLLCPW